MVAQTCEQRLNKRVSSPFGNARLERSFSLVSTAAKREREFVQEDQLLWKAVKPVSRS